MTFRFHCYTECDEHEEYELILENMKHVGEEEIFRKLSLEGCKIKCDDDPYCNYFSHNISTSICRIMHEMTNSTVQPYIDEENDAFLLCKKSEKTMKLMKTYSCNIVCFN